MSLRELMQTVAKTTRAFDGTCGLYVSVQPTYYSCSKLQEWTRSIMPVLDDSAKLSELDEYHCTVMYSREASVSVSLDAKSSDYFLARLVRFEYWDGHDNDGYIVAVLSSPDLVKRNQYWASVGAKHSFADYTSHVTLVTALTATPELRAKLAKLSRQLQGSVLSFTQETLENTNQ